MPPTQRRNPNVRSVCGSAKRPTVGARRRSVGARSPPNQSKEGTMDTTCVVGTDIATFYLYEPEALQHRMHSASDWFYDLGSTQADLGQVTIPERLDGRLVVIDTALPLSVEHEGATRLVWCGSDGAYVFRCTTGTLTTAEVALEYPETRERLAADRIHVTHERLLLDGGYCLPPSSTPSMLDAVERQLCAWLALPNGTYEVTPHYLDASEDDPDEELLTTIVLTF